MSFCSADFPTITGKSTITAAGLKTARFNLVVFYYPTDCYQLVWVKVVTTYSGAAFSIVHRYAFVVYS